MPRKTGTYESTSTAGETVKVFVPLVLRLSVRLLNGAHSRLLAGLRNEAKKPGKLRRSQNWIGRILMGRIWSV